MRFLNTSLVAFLLLMAAACGHTPTGDDGAGEEVFPFAVGTTWTYRWHDLLNDTVDTVVVSVVGTENLPGVGEARVMVYDHPDWAEIVFLSVRGDTVEFLPKSRFMANAARFVLPLAEGSKWRGTHQNQDTCWVSGREPVTVPMGTFPRAFRVQETWAFPWVSYGWVVTWVVPGLGVVREFRHVVYPRVGYDRELIGFKPADGP